jgi:hypothetical protein
MRLLDRRARRESEFLAQRPAHGVVDAHGLADEFVMALGPAGELIRLAGQTEELHSNIVTALNEALAEFREPDGSAIRAPGSSWIVGARSPGT